MNNIEAPNSALDSSTSETNVKGNDKSEPAEEESEDIRLQKALLHDIFTSLDSDGSGHLSKREFRRAILRRPDLGQFVNMKTFHKSFEKFDTNADGFVTFDEFQEYCLKKEQK